MRILLIDNFAGNIQEKYKYSKIINVTSISELIEVIQIFDLNPNYFELEIEAYKLMNTEMMKYKSIINMKYLGKDFKQVIGKGLLHIYREFYIKAVIMYIMNNIPADCHMDFITMNNYPVQKDNIVLIRPYSRKRLVLKAIYRITHHFITSKGTNVKIGDKIIVFINSLSKLELFNSIFPELTQYTVINIEQVGNDRINHFSKYCNLHGISIHKIKKHMNRKYIPHIIYGIMRSALRIREMTHLRAVYLLLDAIMYYSVLKDSMSNNTKLMIMSDEYSYYNDIQCMVAKEKSIRTVNFQHGGIYLFDYYFDRFLVLSEKHKDIYIKETLSRPQQIRVTGKPFKPKQRELNQRDDDKLNILFAAQYITGYMTEAIMKMLCDIVVEISYKHNITVKEHPADNSRILRKNLEGKQNIQFADKQSIITDFDEFDITLSFYSTMLIESIMAGVPAISVNPMRMRGIQILDTSEIVQLASAAQLLSFFNDILANRTLLEEMAAEQKKKVSAVYLGCMYDKKEVDTFIMESIR